MTGDLPPLLDAATRGDLDRVKELLEAGAGIDTKVPGGDTALILAARNQHLTVVQYLLSQGVDVHARNCVTQSALSWAVNRNHPESIELLIRSGADPNTTLNAFTVLGQACSARKERCENRPQGWPFVPHSTATSIAASSDCAKQA